MKRKHEVQRLARKVKGRLTTVFDPEHLEVLARQNAFIQRSSSKLRGRDFVELMTTALLEDPSMSLEGLCDTLGDLNPHAQMTPQALHQRLNPSAVSYLQDVFALACVSSLNPFASAFRSGRWRRLLGCCSKTVRNAAYMQSSPRTLKAPVAAPAPPR